MAQYQVPQFVDVEDRIIGPLTIRQFMYLAVGAALLVLNWFLFEFFLWLILSVPIVAVSIALAFLKINDRQLIYFVLSFIAYIFRPRRYIWLRKPEEARKFEAPPPATPEAPAQPEEKVSRSRLKELALSLDIAAKRKMNQ